MSRVSVDSAVVRGLVGTLSLLAIVLAAFNLEDLPLVTNRDVIHVQFAEAGGLRRGDAVQVSGAQVGEVRSVRLEGDHVVADLSISNRNLKLGSMTEARIITVTLLGRAAVELKPGPVGQLRAGSTIPRARTSSPYNLTSTLNQLSDTSAQIDKEQLAEALKQASATLNATSADLGPALDGLTALSSAVSDNDDELLSLARRASHVSGILASRNDEISSLLAAGRSLMSELADRQDVVIALFRSARKLSAQLHLLMRDTDEPLQTALTELNRVVEVLNRNRKHLQSTITGLRGYVTAYGEAVSSGPWFDVYVQNLLSPTSIAPGLSGASR